MMSDKNLLETISQDQCEVEGAEQYVIRLSAEQQLEFWSALHAPVRLTKAQRELGRLMRGEK